MRSGFGRGRRFAHASNRGLAGVCLVYKVAGALAEQGGSLDEVFKVAEYTAANVGTIGVGLEHCHVRVSISHPLKDIINLAVRRFQELLSAPPT